MTDDLTTATSASSNDHEPGHLRRTFTRVRDLFVCLIGGGRRWATVDDISTVVDTVDEWQAVRTTSGHEVIVAAVPAADGTMTREIVVLRPPKFILTGEGRGALSALWYEFRLRALARPVQAVVVGFVSALVALLAVPLIVAGNPLLTDLIVGAAGFACGVVALLSFAAGFATSLRGINRAGWIPRSAHSLYAPVRTGKDGRMTLEDDQRLRALCDALNDADGALVGQAFGEEVDQQGRRTRRAPVRWVSITAALGTVGAGATAIGEFFEVDRREATEKVLGLDPDLVIGVGALLFLVVFPVLVYLGNVAGARSRDRWNDPIWTTQSATRGPDDSSSSS